MADGILINGKVQPKHTKAINMRFHWLRYRERQEQFRFHWQPGKLNYADSRTKYHPAEHHKNAQKELLTPLVVLNMLQQEQAKAHIMTVATA